MQTTRDTIVGQRSVRLVYAVALPDAPPRAVTVLVHGMGEHTGRYAHVVEALVSQGYAVFAIDHRGHGASGGARVNVERFDDFVEDLYLLASKAQKAYPDLPMYMIGHSMGALIAIRFALVHQPMLAGLVVSGAALQIGDDVSPLLKKLARLIATIAPGMPVTSGHVSAESILSRDPAIQQAFDADPLCYKGKVKARMGYQLMTAASDARSRMAQLTLPLLAMHGTEDKFTNPNGSVQLYEQARSADKTLKLWEGCRHEIYNEWEKAEVIAVLLSWLNERVDTGMHKAAELHPALPTHKS